MSRRRVWPWLAGTTGAVLLIGATVAGGLFLTREDPGAKPIGDAVDEYRTDSGIDAESSAGDPRPPAGVYTLTGEGSEAISLPPVDQTDGDTIPMTITHDESDCWTLRIDYNEAHWQDWSLCTVEGDVFENGGRTSQRWDFGATEVGTLAEFVCDPPVPFAPMTAEPDDTFERSCVGTNDAVDGTTTSNGTLTVLQPASITVGGEEIEARGFRIDAGFTGSQTGSEEVELWFATGTRLPLRGLRSVTIDSDSPIGTVTYGEAGTWELSSTEPQR